MTVENFVNALEFQFSRHPFRPFTVVLKGGKPLQVDHLGALLFERDTGIAYVAGPGGRLHAFDHDSVAQVVDDIDNQPLDAAEASAEA